MSDIEAKNVDNETNSDFRSTLGSQNEQHEPREATKAVNWSVWRKTYHTAVPCFLAFLM